MVATEGTSCARTPPTKEPETWEKTPHTPNHLPWHLLPQEPCLCTWRGQSVCSQMQGSALQTLGPGGTYCALPPPTEAPERPGSSLTKTATIPHSTMTTRILALTTPGRTKTRVLPPYHLEKPQSNISDHQRHRRT